MNRWSVIEIIFSWRFSLYSSWIKQKKDTLRGCRDHLTNPSRVFLHDDSKRSHLLEYNEVYHRRMICYKHLHIAWKIRRRGLNHLTAVKFFYSHPCRQSQKIFAELQDSRRNVPYLHFVLNSHQICTVSEMKTRIQKVSHGCKVYLSSSYHTEGTHYQKQTRLTCLARRLGRGPWYFITPVHDATNTLQINSTKPLCSKRQIP